MGIFEGLPISPWLANVMIHSCLKKAGWLENNELSVRLYADDISKYLSKKGFDFMGENFVDKWNKHPVFIEHGILLDKAKSKWVKVADSWEGELKLLGISYDGDNSTITAKTRGRAETPFTEAKSPTTYLLETDFNLLNNIVNRVTSKYPHLIKKCEKLLRVKDLPSLYRELESEFNTIIALMFQGGRRQKK